MKRRQLSGRIFMWAAKGVPVAAPNGGRRVGRSAIRGRNHSLELGLAGAAAPAAAASAAS